MAAGGGVAPCAVILSFFVAAAVAECGGVFAGVSAVAESAGGPATVAEEFVVAVGLAAGVTAVWPVACAGAVTAAFAGGVSGAVDGGAASPASGFRQTNT